jgi:acetyl esterase
VLTPEVGLDIYDETYCRHGQRSLLVRIYRPPGRGPFPAMLSIHGGIWCSGARDTNASLDKAVARSGILVVAADFRQPPDAGYPASIADVNLAARWTRANAPRFGGLDDPIGGLGTSTGAHQLLLNALRPRDPRYTSAPLAAAGSPAAAAALRYLALCWPVTDPLERYRWARRASRPTLTRAHEMYWGNEAAMAEGSPQLILDRGETNPADLPELLIVQGSADENIPAGMTERFAHAYRAAGGAADLRTFEGMPHGFISRDPGQRQSAEAIELICRFAARQSGVSGPAASEGSPS